jgi:hypothetical protein
MLESEEPPNGSGCACSPSAPPSPGEDDDSCCTSRPPRPGRACSSPGTPASPPSRPDPTARVLTDRPPARPLVTWKTTTTGTDIPATVLPPRQNQPRDTGNHAGDVIDPDPCKIGVSATGQRSTRQSCQRTNAWCPSVPPGPQAPWKLSRPSVVAQTFKGYV